MSKIQDITNKILDQLELVVYGKKDILKTSNLMPSMVFIGVSLNFGILEYPRI